MDKIIVESYMVTGLLIASVFYFLYKVGCWVIGEPESRNIEDL